VEQRRRRHEGGFYFHSFPVVFLCLLIIRIIFPSRVRGQNDGFVLGISGRVLWGEERDHGQITTDLRGHVRRSISIFI
jgi:hypothetical protein